MPESKPDPEQEVREARQNAYEFACYAACRDFELPSSCATNDGTGLWCSMCEGKRAALDRFEAAVRADERAKSELERLSALRGAYLDTAIHHSPCPECDNAVKRLNEEIRHLGL